MADNFIHSLFTSQLILPFFYFGQLLCVCRRLLLVGFDVCECVCSDAELREMQQVGLLHALRLPTRACWQVRRLEKLRLELELAGRTGGDGLVDDVELPLLQEEVRLGVASVLALQAQCLSASFIFLVLVLLDFKGRVSCCFGALLKRIRVVLLVT